MASSASRNNVTAGTFLLISLLLAVGMSFWIGGLREAMVPRNDYTVRFDIADATDGLSPGSPVIVGGQRQGRVKKVDIDYAAEGGPALVVEIEVTKDAVLTTETRATLVKAPLATLATLNLLHVGPQGDGHDFEGEEAPVVIAEGATIPGVSTGGGPFGLDTSVFASIKDAADEARELLERVDRMAAGIEPAFTTDEGDFRQTLAGVREVVDNARGPWSAEIDGVLSSANRLMGPEGDVAKGFAEARLATQDIRVAALDARRTVNTAQMVLEENRPAIRQLLRHAEAAAADVRFVTIERANNLLSEGRIAVAGFGGISDELNLLLRTETPTIRRTLANARLFSEELRYTIGEIRSQPWRLLGEPSKEEKRKAPLYDAARAYAAAVGDLRAASESLESLVARAGGEEGEAGLIDQAEIAGMTRRVREAFDEYRRAEARMLELLAEK